MTTTTTTLASLPDEVATTTRAWRFSKGAICTGREEDGTYEERPAIVGFLRRVGIFDGELQDGTPYAKLEAVIETKDGPVSIGASLKGATNGGKPTYASCISFAEGLLDCDKDEIIQVKAGQSAKPNKFGAYSTYANVFHVRSASAAERTKPYPYPSEMEYGDARLDYLVEQIRLHPAYGERPKREPEEEYAGAEAEFAKAIEKAGWPSFDAATPAYLAIASKAGKEDYAAASDVPAAIWHSMTLVVESGKRMPPSLQKIADGVDPFAED